MRRRFRRRRHVLVLAVDDVWVARRRRRAVLEPLDADAGPNIAQYGMAHRRCQQREPDRIGKETRSEQERPRNEDHRPVRQRFSGVPEILERRAQAIQLRKALRPDEPRAENRRQNDDPERRPEPDQTADLNEQRDLDERNGDKQN